MYPPRQQKDHLPPLRSKYPGVAINAKVEGQLQKLRTTVTATQKQLEKEKMDYKDRITKLMKVQKQHIHQPKAVWDLALRDDGELHVDLPKLMRINSPGASSGSRSGVSPRGRSNSPQPDTTSDGRGERRKPVGGNYAQYNQRSPKPLLGPGLAPMRGYRGPHAHPLVALRIACVRTQTFMRFWWASKRTALQIADVQLKRNATQAKLTKARTVGVAAVQRYARLRISRMQVCMRRFNASIVLVQKMLKTRGSKHATNHVRHGLTVKKHIIKVQQFARQRVSAMLASEKTNRVYSAVVRVQSELRARFCRQAIPPRAPPTPPNKPLTAAQQKAKLERLKEARLKARVSCMLRTYDADRMHRLGNILQKYEGKENECISDLVKEYGPEPDINELFTERINLMFAAYMAEALDEASIAQLQYANQEDFYLEALTARFGPEPDPKFPFKPRTYRRRVKKMFETYKPFMLPFVDEELAAAKNPEKYIAKLVKKYGPEPPAVEHRRPTGDDAPWVDRSKVQQDSSQLYDL